ncbi:MAG: anthranilate phosphoribosyltransferase family protein [Limnoraphis robusta]|jgi:anthranilate phosphoribosyltransferase
MSDRFRELLRKIGSGPHTGENLNRTEAAEAMKMMLLQEATPAQIGAFLIAHRIKRPTGEELAGMLDGCDWFASKLQPLSTPPLILNCPYDGRSRTAPVAPLTALIVATAGVSVILHGGDTMPTKEGIPLIEVWQGLGVDWTTLTLERVQQVLETTGVGFVYLPRHFPEAAALVSYRREIGKRPPLATMELMWSPYAGVATLACGYVHPPTEVLFRETFKWRGTTQFISVKGLEGSCDLPRDRTCIIGVHQLSRQSDEDYHLERWLLHPSDYGFGGKEVPLESSTHLFAEMQRVVQGQAGELMQAAVWNGGFYLWQCGVCSDLESGLSTAQQLLIDGVAEKLETLRLAVHG